MNSEATPQVFMSYTHSDNEFRGGDLTTLREQIEKTFKFRSGDEIRIFQDIEGVNVGHNIQQRIVESLNETFVLLPIITPSYLKSAWCRDEFQRFLERERTLGSNELILPIYYQDVPELNAARRHPSQAQPSNDPIITALAPRLAADWRKLQERPMDDPEVQKKLNDIADRIKQIIDTIGSRRSTVGIFSYDPAGYDTSTSKKYTWANRLAAGLDVPDFWQTILPRDLGQLRQELGNAGVKHVTLYPKAHLSVALAFGYTFRATTGINISIEQRGDWWHTGACSTAPSQTPPLTEKLEEVAPAPVGSGAASPGGRTPTRNELVAFLARLPVFGNSNQRETLLRQAGLDRFIPSLSHDSNADTYVDTLLNTLEQAGGSQYLQPLFAAVTARAHLGGDPLNRFNQLQQAYLAIEGAAPRPSEHHQAVDAKGTDLTVEISAVRGQRVEAAVNRWIDETRPPIKWRLHLSLPNTDTDEVRDAEHALAIACQVRAALLRARREHLPQQTHLFAVIPAGLGVLIGWLLNACEPVQCYDFDRQISRYVRTCHLTPKFASQQ